MAGLAITAGVAGTTDATLEVSGLLMRFQGITALDDVSFSTSPGAITSLIGPNGAGKTTLFNCVTGMYTPTSGRVSFGGEDLTGKAAHVVARHGIARTFQNLALFQGLSVLDNLTLGGYLQGRTGLLSGGLLTPRARRERREALAAGMQMLEFLGIKHAANALPGELPYGQQKQIEFARALMQKARLVLLDEPMAGMGDGEKADMSALIRRVRDEMGVGFLIVEHDIPVIMDISDRIVVLDFGRKIAEGLPGDIQANPAVIAAYLGAPSPKVASASRPATATAST